MSNPEASRKRGRPAIYASKEAKAQAAVQRKRAKRELERFEQRAAASNQFCGTYQNAASSSIIPTIIDGNVDTTNVQPSVEETPEEFAEQPAVFIDDTFEFDAFAQYLPPPSPDLPPDLPTLENDEHLDIEPIGNANGVDDDTIVVAPQPPLDRSANDDVDDLVKVERLADQLLDQLAGFRGCCAECHEQAEAEHRDQFQQHTSLSEYLESTADLCPDVLGTERIASREDDLTHRMTADERRQLYCGRESDHEAPHICLRPDEPQNDHARVSFDIDSVTAFPTNIAIAKQGIRWHPTQMPVSDLQSSLHLRPQAVHFVDNAGRRHTVHRPVHKIPHYTLGRLVGFQDISLYVLFPHLYREDQASSRLRDVDFRLWMDGVLLPVIYQHHESDSTQHYPSDHDHARSNATARGVESLSQRSHPVAREQQMFSFLRPETLRPIWETVLEAVRRPGYQQFDDVRIVLHAKNLKVLMKGVTWEGMMERFQRYWAGVIDETYITAELYLDVGREIYPPQASRVAVDPLGSQSQDDVVAETLVWKRCCMEACSDFLQQELPPDSVKRTYYPLSMLHDTGSLTLEPRPSAGWRRDHLLYSQYYPSGVKEVFAAGDVYPFANNAIEALALDRKLRRTWELVGKGLSHNPVALIKGYLYAKWRCHTGLRGSIKKALGVREEHRMSVQLFRAVDERFQSRGLHRERLRLPSGSNSPYYSFRTSTMLRWLRRNINKFCVGFETVFSGQDPHFVTWEHTRLMLMFLRCLRVSYGGGLLQKSGGCWRDVRHVPDDRQPDGLRRVEGLGFCRTMEEFGYAWFLDKVDWATLTFRPTHAPYMMFNNPSMQAVYRRHYGRIRDVRIDFIRVDRIRQWMIEFSGVTACVERLEILLCQLCLCAFRKDIFAHIQSTLQADSVEAALAGEVPLCYESIQEVLQEQYRPLQLAYGPRVAVKNIDVLFAWLWEWRDGRFERSGWNDKPYRMLYRQSYEAIQAVRGKHSARSWRRTVKTTFLRSHWMLPYPNKRTFMRRHKDSGSFMWWPSFHCGLYEYYRRLYPRNRPEILLPASNTQHHPSEGWQLAPKSYRKHYMPFVVQLDHGMISLSDEELYEGLVELRNGSDQDRNVERDTGIAVTWGSEPRRPVEWTEFSRWCSKRLRRVKVTMEDCKTADDCQEFLEEEMEKYEAFQHREGRHRRQRQQRRRGGQRGESVARSGSDSGSNQVERSEGETSDEASMVQKKRRQGKRVQEMREMMEEYPMRGAASGVNKVESGIERIRVVQWNRAATSEEESEDIEEEYEEGSEG